MNTRGIHYVADFWDVPEEIIKNNDLLYDSMLEAAKESRMTVVGEERVNFQPHGLTAVLVLAESHMSIHTFPEEGYIAVDIFTCGDLSSPDMAIEILLSKYKPGHNKTSKIIRGEK